MSADRDGLLSLGEVRRLYDRLAPLYDLATAPYRALGGYRLVTDAVEELRLTAGDTVVELGTGTGYALPALSAAVGPTGRVVAVDISRRMLTRARARCRRHGLDNVQLVQADIVEYRLPVGTTAVLSAFAMEMVPQYDGVIADLVDQLRPGGRLAVTGLRDPKGWPEWLIRLGRWAQPAFRRVGCLPAPPPVGGRGRAHVRGQLHRHLRRCRLPVDRRGVRPSTLGA
jgi:ubiquinone/menaquinone biosynthesis C-methylase UbiE